MLYLTRLAVALLATSVTAGAERTSPAFTTLCDGSKAESVTPIGAGPLKLATVRCLQLPPDYRGAASRFAPSPDGDLYFTVDESDDLWVGSFETKEPPQHFEADLTGHSPLDFDSPSTWFKDGRSVLAVTQDKMKPGGGWALGPLKPFLASIDGQKRLLPELVSDAGPLDEIHWVGHKGLAVVLFGAKGSYYRPEHADPRPTIALVDAFAGRVIQSVPLADLVPDASRPI
jgi:hypothetical protein